MSHNHPSGNCRPSEEDIKVTEILEKVSVIMGIELLDHVIVSRETYFSFLENKMLKKDEKKERAESVLLRASENSCNIN